MSEKEQAALDKFFDKQPRFSPDEIIDMAIRHWVRVAWGAACIWKDHSHPYKIPRWRYMGNLTETKETQNMQYEYIKKLKAALRDTLEDLKAGRSESAKIPFEKLYAEEIALCGLEVDDG